MQLVLNVLLYDLNITLLGILKGLTFLLTALRPLIKLRGHRILGVRKMEEAGRVGKHCL